MVTICYPVDYGFASARANFKYNVVYKVQEKEWYSSENGRIILLTFPIVSIKLIIPTREVDLYSLQKKM